MIHKSLLLGSLALAPALSSMPMPINNSTQNIEYVEEETEQEQEESCTVMYVGKDVSESGKAYCCRCGDTWPLGLNINATIFEHNQLANVTTKGKNGFEWTMPGTTYRYISTPRNPAVRKGLHWEVSAINEMGVCASGTLSCNSNNVALSFEPFEATGISEDNLAQIMGATGTSAKQAMQTIASILDDKGSAESNIIMAVDKDEAWLMEIYTGHQYAAIKLPDDKACTIGNEFFLNTLAELGISEATKDNCILSPKLLSLAKDNNFAKFDSSGTQDVYHLHLYNTYGGGDGGQGSFADNCHMRTWRGRSLFMENPEEYSNSVKYEPFFTPKKKLSVTDIISYFRDRFESILNNPEDPNYETFHAASEAGSLRCVGDKSTYQVHIMSVNPDLPREISAEETIALANANYTPFIPLNAGVTSMSDYFTHVSQNYGYDENSAYYIFKRLNGLADTDRTNYGLPVQSLMADQEGIWQAHYNELLNQIKTLSLNVQRNVLTNYCTSLQEGALAISNAVFNDLLWHIITTSKSSVTTFKPFASLEYCAWLYGWDYSLDNKVATLKSNNDTIKIDFDYTDIPLYGWVTGKLTKNNEDPVNIRVTVKESVPCIDYEAANNYIAAGHDLVPIVWQDWCTVDTRPSWVIPVAISVPITAILIAAGIVFGVKHHKKKIAMNNQ